MALIISWQFMGWPVSLRICAAASRALRFLGLAALLAAAGPSLVWAAAARVGFLALASAFAAGVAGAMLLSSLAERLPFWGMVLVAFFLVAMMHLLREWVKTPGRVLIASPNRTGQLPRQAN